MRAVVGPRMQTPLGRTETEQQFVSHMMGASLTWVYPTGDSASQQSNVIKYTEQTRSSNLESTTSTPYALAPLFTIKIDSVDPSVNALKATSFMTLVLALSFIAIGLESGIWMLTIGGIGLIATVFAALRESR